MIILNQDIFSNFRASMISGDSDLSMGIIVNEISDFIVYDTRKFVQVLKKSGVEANLDMTDEALVDLFIKNISVNKNIANALAFQISDANGIINKGKPNEVTKKNWLQKIDIFANGISGIGNNCIANEELAIKFKEDIMKQIETKAKAKGNYKRVIYNRNNKKILLVLGGIAVLAIVGFILYNKYADKFKNGGSIDGQNIEPQTPTPTIPSVEQMNAPVGTNIQSATVPQGMNGGLANNMQV